MEEVASWSVKLGVPGGPAVATVVAILLLLLALMSVRQILGVLGSGRRAALIALRVLTLVIAGLLALQPQWVTERVENVEGRLSVLLDVSRSMSIRDGDTTRAERARHVIGRWREQGNVPFDLHGFGERLRPLEWDAIGSTGLARDDDTRIQRALEQVIDEQGEELGAVVLLSDGSDMAHGWLPEHAAKLGVRTHTISFASSRSITDEGIVRVNADPVAFLRQAAEVEVSVRSTRVAGEPLVVTLRHEGEVVAEATAELDENGEGKVVLPFTPAAIGRAVYTLSIPLSADDAVPENNERAFLVRVTRDKLRALLVCGAPSWDTRFLRAFLKSDPAIDLITFFILRTESDLTMAPAEELSLIPFPTDELFREHLDSFDIVIFQDFNYGPYQMARYLRRIHDYVQKGGAFAMVGGTKSFGAGGYDRTPLAQILPVKLAPGTHALVEGEFSPMIGPDASRHPLVELVPDATRNQEVWRDLAPLLGANRLTGLREDAVALLTHPTSVIDDGSPMPVLAVGAAGEGRVMALGVDTSWRWGITTAGLHGDASAYERFWDRALRWLARDPLLDPARIQTDRSHYGTGAEVRGHALLRDAAYAPITGAKLELLVLDASGEIFAQREVTTDGEGRAELEAQAPNEPGGYRLVVRDPLGGKVLAEEGFVVEAGGDELADPRARPEVLAELAAVTAGSHHREDAPPALDELDRTRARALGTALHAPFTSPWCFLLGTLACATEWALRRAWGLR